MSLQCIKSKLRRRLLPVFARVLWGKGNEIQEQILQWPDQLLSHQKNEYWCHQDPLSCLEDWVRHSFIFAPTTNLYLQHPTPVNIGCVTERFFAWWKFYVTFCSRGFATPTVTVDGVMWHAAPGQEYLTIIWSLLHPAPNITSWHTGAYCYSVLLSFAHFPFDEQILFNGI